MVTGVLALAYHRRKVSKCIFIQYLCMQFTIDKSEKSVIVISQTKAARA